MTEDDRYRTARDRLLRQAALQSEFLPRDLLLSVLEGDETSDVLLQGQLLSALREASTVAAGARGEGAETWLLRPIARQKALAEGTVAELAPETDIARALRGQGAYAPEALAATLADPPDSATLEGLVKTLERAGPRAPGHGQLLALHGALQTRRSEEEADALLDGVFVGRTDEIGRIEAALDAPQTAPPLQTLHIAGMPGVGKTFLLEQITRLCRARPEIVTVRLDFDRASLRTGETEAIFDETSRQIGYALPAAAEALQRQRLDAAERRTLTRGSDEDSGVFEMLHHMVDVLTGAGRRLLFLLDTLEVLHGHGATRVEQLMQQLDRFAEGGKLPVNVISGGRGRVFREGHKRLRDLLTLDRLEDAISDAILERRGVAEHLRPRIVELARGNPLRLILVSRAVQEEGGDLGEAQIRAAGNGYLYRAILSRVPPDIPRIAAEGLILPQLDSHALTGIVGPALGLEIDAARADEILETLEMQRWLVTRHPDGGLAHDPEVREEILELTYEQSPAHTAAINRRAVEVFADTDPLRHYYHRLQLCRAGEAPPEVPADIAWQIEGTLLQDLPPEARDAVLRARGERSSADMDEMAVPESAQVGGRLRQAAARTRQVWLQVDPGAPTCRLVLVDPPTEPRPIGIDDGALTDLRNMLERGDRREASHLMRTRFAQPFPHDSAAGRLALVHQWRTGQWSMARILLDLTAPERLEEALAEDPGLSGITLLELWAEFRHAELCRRLADKALCKAARRAISSAAGTRLRGGALEFAFLSAVGPGALEDGDALAAVVPYLPDASSEPAIALQNRAEALRGSYGLTFAPGQSDPRKQSGVHAAAAIAPLNPYAEPVLALVEEYEATGRRKILDDLLDFRRGLTELAELFAPDVSGVKALQDRLAPRPGEVMHALSALGLTAEFARGYTFYSPLSDLPTVALAAERWQQAVSGGWPWDSPPPEGWTGPGAIDATVWARALALDGIDPEGAIARRALRIWFDPSRDTPRETPAMLRKRLAGVYGEIRGAGLALRERLEILHAAGVPTVLQPSVAVLAARGIPPDDLF